MGLRDVARGLVLRTVSGMRLNDLALFLQRGSTSSSRIVVVEMHETLSADADRLRRQFEWVAERFTFIDPETFARAWDKRVPTWPGSKPAVLFTFDDGRECNYRLAPPILESFGTRGIFFVVPEFIAKSANQAKDFYYSDIDIRKRACADDHNGEIWKPMAPEQLADLASRGHWIGSHTFSHVGIGGLSASELHRQIRESCQQIISWTGKPVDAFAWPYSWDAIDRDSWKAVKEVHRFCFAPCPGTVDLATDSQYLIWRKEIEAHYSPSEYQFMYSGIVDPIWAGKRSKLRERLSQAS